jgi:hypothetical protein
MAAPFSLHEQFHSHRVLANMPTPSKEIPPDGGQDMEAKPGSEGETVVLPQKQEAGSSGRAGSDEASDETEDDPEE